MQLFNDVTRKVAEFAKDNATTLLTAGGVVGTVATAVLAGRAGIKAGRILEAADQQGWAEEVNYEMPTTVEKVKRVGIHFVPPVLTGTTTVAAIIMSNRMSAQKAAALAAAYGLAERNFSDYKDKIEEKLTGPKKTAVDDELAQEAVDKAKGSEKIVFVEGEVLCFDKPTGRYFNSTMETIKQAVNTTNAEIFNHGFTTLNFFYDELGLKPTTWSGEVGYDTGHLLELDISTVMAPGNRPCIAIDFKSMPKVDNDPKYS